MTPRDIARLLVVQAGLEVLCEFAGVDVFAPTHCISEELRVRLVEEARVRREQNLEILEAFSFFF